MSDKNWYPLTNMVNMVFGLPVFKISIVLATLNVFNSYKISVFDS